jgi:hypothetical protein
MFLGVIQDGLGIRTSGRAYIHEFLVAHVPEGRKNTTRINRRPWLCCPSSPSRVLAAAEHRDLNFKDGDRPLDSDHSCI